MKRRTFLGAVAASSLAATRSAAANAMAVVVLTPDEDFAHRIGGPGVVRYFHFNDPSQLNGKRTTACAGSYWDYQTLQASGIQQGNTTMPTLDPAVRASGASSLRYTYLSQSGQDGAGLFYTNFSSDFTAMFGDATEPQQTPGGNEFYVQWAQRFSPEILETVFVTGTGAPVDQKLAIVTAGDIPPGWLTTGGPNGVGYPKGRDMASCEKVETVVTRHWNNPLITVYNECGVYRPFQVPWPQPGAGDFNLQNAMPSPYCTYRTINSMGGGYNTRPVPGCFNVTAGPWYTFQAGFTLGPRDRVNRRFTNSTFKLWACKKGEPSQLLFDWNPNVTGYFPLCDGEKDTPEWFGAVYMLPYMYQKDPAQVHPPASTWIDELIISKRRIPDPMV